MRTRRRILLPVSCLVVLGIVGAVVAIRTKPWIGEQQRANEGYVKSLSFSDGFARTRQYSEKASLITYIVGPPKPVNPEDIVRGPALKFPPFEHRSETDRNFIVFANGTGEADAGITCNVELGRFRAGGKIATDYGVKFFQRRDLEAGNLQLLKITVTCYGAQ